MVILPSRLWGCASCGLSINYSIGISNSDASDDRAERTRPAAPSVEQRNQENRRKQILSSREVAERLITQLASGKKYDRALNTGEFATFSIIGTNDWEDYASLSFRALTLKSLLRIEQSLDEQKEIHLETNHLLEKLIENWSSLPSSDNS